MQRIRRDAALTDRYLRNERGVSRQTRAERGPQGEGGRSIEIVKILVQRFELEVVHSESLSHYYRCERTQSAVLPQAVDQL